MKNKNNRFTLLLLTLLTSILIFFFTYVAKIPTSPSITNYASNPYFIISFLGGLLAIISPCSLAVLPSFFAYSFSDKKDLVKMTYVFFLGLLLIFVPLGFGSSYISIIFKLYRAETFFILGLILIVLAVIKIFDINLFSHNFILPKTENKTIEVYLMGVFFSFTTIACTGPILGSILTLSLSSGFSSGLSIFYYTMFGLGIVTPLFILSLIFQKYRLNNVIKNKTIKISLFGKKIISNRYNIFSGAMILLFGIVLMFYEKFSSVFSSTQEQLGVTNLYVFLTEKIYSGGKTVELIVFSILIIFLLYFFIIKKSSNKR